MPCGPALPGTQWMRDANSRRSSSPTSWLLCSRTDAKTSSRNSSRLRSSSEVATTRSPSMSCDSCRCSSPGRSLRLARSPVAPKRTTVVAGMAPALRRSVPAGRSPRSGRRSGRVRRVCGLGRGRLDPWPRAPAPDDGTESPHGLASRIDHARARAEEAAARYRELARRDPVYALPIVALTTYVARQGMLLASAIAFRTFLWLMPLALLAAGLLTGLGRSSPFIAERAQSTTGVSRGRAPAGGRRAGGRRPVLVGGRRRRVRSASSGPPER